MKRILYLILISTYLFSCQKEAIDSPLFELKTGEEIGIPFENKLGFSNKFNVYKYRNYYNGGGVSIGDINNDGLVDIYMVANEKSNHLYLNKGNWKFEDITEKAGVGGQKAWSTGVSMVDINADGHLDIYVCNSGDVSGDNKENELFINNGDMTFKESAEAYNLNDKGFSTHASFFDYDKDGDLDAYILNNSFQAIGSFNLRKNERTKRDQLGGDKLMKNENGVFVDVSEEAGIYGSVIGFGLGITVGDVNNDNWEDIFISNDFFERDYLYINQKDGTFKEDLVEQIPSISGASMGADIGDIDNDGMNEIFVTEMLPDQYERLKTVTTFDDWDRYQLGVQNDYHHQFTRNTLHYNNGNNTFSEISRFLGVEASDWSWGALFFDMENDGYKDLFIANGIYRDLTNQDYLQYIANESVLTSIIKEEGVDYQQLIDIIPSNKVANHSYRNTGNLNFDPYTSSGLMTEGFSNGSAYGDLDNDGDLDLVVNNVNMPCFVYENHSDSKPKNNFLKLILKGGVQNTLGIGAKIKVSAGNSQWHYENQPIRGFQSSMDPRPNIGIGNNEVVDVDVIWPNGRVTSLKEIQANQTLTIDEKDSADPSPSKVPQKLKKFEEVDISTALAHKENMYVDFNRERLNYHMLSTRGPCVSHEDLNKDGIKDFIIPGSKKSQTQILLANNDGNYSPSSSDVFDKLKEAEHVKCEVFDADQDGDLDVYLASGGVEVSEYSELLYDRLLLNNGKGEFSTSNQNLPVYSAKMSTGAVCNGDIDQDGDLDLFVGERVKIGQFGATCSGYILINDGQGNFTDQTQSICPDLMQTGMITDAKMEDMDKDGQLDLIVVGEFMDIQVYKNEGNKLTKQDIGEELNGWWNVLHLADIDQDGDQDIIVGNHGLNSRFKASKNNPISIYFDDFDHNGFPEGIMTKRREDGNDYPYALRHNLMARLPHLKKKYPDFESFKQATIHDIIGEEALKEASVLSANEMQSIILVNDGNFNFSKKTLPPSVQWSPIYAIAHADCDNDGDQDLILGGNLYNVQPEMGRYDASYGHVLINDGKGNFVDHSQDLGFTIKGEIRDIEVSGDQVYVFRNNDKAVAFKMILE